MCRFHTGLCKLYVGLIRFYTGFLLVLYRLCRGLGSISTFMSPCGRYIVWSAVRSGDAVLLSESSIHITAQLSGNADQISSVEQHTAPVLQPMSIKKRRKIAQQAVRRGSRTFCLFFPRFFLGFLTLFP